MATAEFEDSMFFMGGEAEHSAEHSEDEAALDSFSSEDDLGMFPQGISIAGATSDSEKSSTLRASLDDRSLPTASPPVSMPQPAPARGFAMPISASLPARTSTSKLGTSAPIAIPNMARWRPGAPDSGAPKEVATTFIPPHQLSRQDDFHFSLVGASPAGALKRDRLRTRNAILRSTGFLEPNAGGAAASANGGAAAGGAGLPPAAPPAPAAVQMPRPAVSQSTLTAALTTIGEM